MLETNILVLTKFILELSTEIIVGMTVYKKTLSNKHMQLCNQLEHQQKVVQRDSRPFKGRFFFRDDNEPSENEVFAYSSFVEATK